MARSFTRHVRGRPVSVRQNLWLFTDIDEGVVTPDSIALVGQLNAAALALRPFTIVRTHTLVRWVSDQSAVSESARAVFGKLVITDEAAAVGVTAIPGPVLNADASWFVWQAMAFQFLFSSGVGVDAQNGTNYFIDSKAMRKVGPNDTVVSVVENVDDAHGGSFQAVGRFLIKLH